MTSVKDIPLPRQDKKGTNLQTMVINKLNILKMETKNFLKSVFACVLLSGVVFTMASCSDDDDNAPAPKTDKTTLQNLIEDNIAAIVAYPEFYGHFMEAQYELTGKVSDLDLKDLKPVNVHYVWYYVDRVQNPDNPKEYGNVPYLLEQDRDFIVGRTTQLEKTRVNSPWIWDMTMSNFDHLISLEEVIKIIKTSEYAELAQTRFITLRAPVISDELFPEREYAAQYVFGGSEDRDEHILVDAVTGTINVLEK